ncbi:MAG: type VII toxin-antitoxin system HepT family RNase toxin [Candidatus Thorarchaeota archaeon]
MVSRDVVNSRISLIEQALIVLESVREDGLDNYLSSFETRLMAERALHIAIEACIDMASHVVSVLALGRPASYVDVFKILRDRGLIDTDLAEQMMRMVRFRHRLVHMYSTIDNTLVFRFISEDLKDIRRFVRAMVQIVSST